MKCLPRHGFCNREAGHSGAHSQLTEREYREQETKRTRILVEAEAASPWCRDPLRVNSWI